MNDHVAPPSVLAQAPIWQPLAFPQPALPPELFCGAMPWPCA